MSSLVLNQEPIPSACHLAILDWIQVVSQHPSWYSPSMTNVSLPSDDEDEEVPQASSLQYAVVVHRPSKRVRADSDLSPLVERHRVVIHSRKQTPYESHPSTRCSTPTESIPDDGESAAPSQSDYTDTATVRTRRERTRERRSKEDPEVELAACIARVAKSTSTAYLGYKSPVMISEPDGTVLYHGFECTKCASAHVVRRRVGTSETAQLASHNSKCVGAGDKSQQLSAFGVTGGWSKPTAAKVRESVALWMAESAHPYQSINDQYFLKLLHPEVKKLIPHRTTIPKDIQCMYQATQLDITADLKKHKGVFHIGLDLYQSSNGYDILGIVIFLLNNNVKAQGGMERFVLECLNFEDSHTGVALANTLHTVLCKFEIEDRVWGVVCDNASNNGAMMARLGDFNLKRLNGPLARVHCVLHVYNLVAQAILRPFRAKRKRLEAAKDLADDDSDDERCGSPEPDEDDPEDDGLSPSWMMVRLGNGDSDKESELPEIESGSLEDAECRRVARVLFKATREAHRLRYNPSAKRAFKAACEAKDVKKPHHIPCDTITRWNSTSDTLDGTDRTWDGCIEYQQNSRFTPRKQRFNPEDRVAIRGLLALLQPLRQATEAMSEAGLPLLADVIVHYDTLNELYGRFANDKGLALYLRHAADRAQVVLNKYYLKTDDSVLYRLALLCHPSLRVHYLKSAKWEQDWIDTAVEIAETCWREHYSSSDHVEPDSAAGLSEHASQFGVTSFMDRVLSTLEHADATVGSPINTFVHGTPIFNTVGGKHVPYDPIIWWQAQQSAGNEHQGLTQMALDVLSTPASSVDVERAFLFVGSVVTKRRHNLTPCTIQATATLGLYSKAGQVKSGILELPRRTKGKGKAVEA